MTYTYWVSEHAHMAARHQRFFTVFRCRGNQSWNVKRDEVPEAYRRYISRHHTDDSACFDERRYAVKVGEALAVLDA